MKVIGTTEISFEIENILNNAERYLVIVTPYIKLNQRLKVRLSDAFKIVNYVYILHRFNELKREELEWLKSFDNVNIYPIKNLHSKIYASENFALIASMNLYEYSQINNHEIGVKIEANSDNDEYVDTLKEIRLILESDHSDKNLNFTKIIENIEDYSMGQLFVDLCQKYKFKSNKSWQQSEYEYISGKAREIVDFDNSELYQDKSAVLRVTDLGKERFSTLKKELVKYAD
ncbi:phospholipase D family protein [Ancylomarina sp. YFZ004]